MRRSSFPSVPELEDASRRRHGGCRWCVRLATDDAHDHLRHSLTVVLSCRAMPITRAITSAIPLRGLIAAKSIREAGGVR